MNQSLKDDKELYHNLKALTDTPGGKILIDGLVQDTIGSMHWLSNSYKTAGEMELRAECSKLQSNLSLLRTLTNSKKNEADVDALIEEALTE